MVRHGKGGDFRNPERIQSWAHDIGAELRQQGGGQAPDAG